MRMTGALTGAEPASRLVIQAFIRFRDYEPDLSHKSTHGEKGDALSFRSPARAGEPLSSLSRGHKVSREETTMSCRCFFDQNLMFHLQVKLQPFLTLSKLGQGIFAAGTISGLEFPCS